MLGWKGNVSGQTVGTKAGRGWDNGKEQLPTTDDSGKSIIYIEFDVNNKAGNARDSERFVVGSDGSVYYTDSHYGERKSLNKLPDFARIKWGGT